MAVTLGFSTEGTDHLGVAVVAAFADINVAACYLKRSVGLHAWDGLGYGRAEKQRHHLDNQPDTNQQKGKNNQVAYFFFGKFLQLHFGSLFFFCGFVALMLLMLCERGNDGIYRFAHYCSTINVISHQYHARQIQQAAG